MTICSTEIRIQKGDLLMKFKYVENDPMDKVPAPAGKMIVTLIGCVGYMIVYLFIWCAIYGWRP